jgi:predicted enzyme related to lactoylglutathione lyase
MASTRFVWHDLMTTDVEAAQAFYADLFGWRYELWKAGERDYPLIVSDDTQQGGIGPLDAPPGTPPHWLSHVAVDDVDAALDRAAARDGTALYGPETVPDVGRVSVLRDPQGAVLGLFTPAGAEPAPDAAQSPGTFCWHELLTSDVGSAKAFYGEVVGWGTDDVDLGEMRTYTRLKAGDADAGGLMAMPADAEAPPNWLVYVAVADAEAAVAKVEAAGGVVYVRATPIPGVGTFAVLADPQGAAFGILQPAA